MTARAESIIGISATRASAILGMNRWKSPVLAWQEIMEKIKPGFNAERGFLLPPKEDKAVFRWGHAFESSIVELAEAAQGDQIKDLEKFAMSIYKGRSCEYTVGPELHPPAFCYLDGVYQKQDRGLILHEGKTTFERAFRASWGEPGTDRIPDHVQIQVQHQMMCSGADQCIVSVLVLPFDVEEREEAGWVVTDRKMKGHSIIEKVENIGDKETSESMPELSRQKQGVNWYNTLFMAQSLNYTGFFHQYPIESKPDSIHKPLREAYDHFWQKYVLTETPPELDDYEDIRRMFPAPVGTLVVSDLVASQCREYKDIGKEIGSGGFLKKKQVQLKTDILKLCLTETTVADDESIEKIVLRDSAGNKCGSFDGKTFRA